MDIVLLGELAGERDTKLVEVGDGVLSYLGACGAAEEEGSLGVLDGFRRLFVHGAFAARVAGFSM